MDVKAITVGGIEAAITAALAHVAGMSILGRAFGPKGKDSLARRVSGRLTGRRKVYQRVYHRAERGGVGTSLRRGRVLEPFPFENRKGKDA